MTNKPEQLTDELHYGENVLWFLNELASFEPGDIDYNDFDVYGEHESGAEGTASVGIVELAADAVKLIAKLQTELQEIRRSYLALRGEIEDVQAQLYEAENRNEADAAELQERRKADNAEPVFFIEVEGDDWIQAGRIPGSTFDFNNLPNGINKLYAAPPAPDEKPMPESSKMHAIDAVAAIAEVRGVERLPRCHASVWQLSGITGWLDSGK